MKTRLLYLLLVLLALAVGGVALGRRGAPGDAARAPTPPPAPALPPPAPRLGAAGPGVILRPSTIYPGYFWRVETVDEGPMYISLALDAQGRPHIAYQAFREGLGYSLRYARFDGARSFGTGRWLTETVDASDRLTGIMPSLALDGAGRPRIAYRIAGDYGDLRYAYYDGSAWAIETADAQGDTGGFASLALDAQDRPHVSYDNGAGCLLYAHRDGLAPRGPGQVWRTETVDCGPGWYGWCTSLELDGKDRPHISYVASWPNDDLLYAWRDGTGWRTAVVESAGHVGYGTSLELAARQRPRISYLGCLDPPTCGTLALKYAWHDGTAWHIEGVDGAKDVGRYTSLALDAADRPHVGYYAETDSELRYARFDGTRWLTETVDDGPAWAGPRNSLALDDQGLPHISYSGGVSMLAGELRYVHLVQLPYAVYLPRLER